MQTRISRRGSVVEEKSGAKDTVSIALLRTCKAVHEEATSFLYMTQLHFKDFLDFAQWVKQVGDERRYVGCASAIAIEEFSIIDITLNIAKFRVFAQLLEGLKDGRVAICKLDCSFEAIVASCNDWSRVDTNGWNVQDLRGRGLTLLCEVISAKDHNKLDGSVFYLLLNGVMQLLLHTGRCKPKSLAECTEHRYARGLIRNLFKDQEHEVRTIVEAWCRGGDTSELINWFFAITD